MVCCEKTNSERERERSARLLGRRSARRLGLSSGSQARVGAHEMERGKRWAAIACLPETRPEGFYGQVCYDRDGSEGEGKKANVGSRWMLSCQRQTRAVMKTVFKVKNFY